jgi:hypothetical protein
MRAGLLIKLKSAVSILEYTQFLTINSSLAFTKLHNALMDVDSDSS